LVYFIKPKKEKMKTFEDLKFRRDDMGKHAFEIFPNHYGISVIRGPYSYGGKQGLYEIAVLIMTPEMKYSEICYDTPIADDVVGYLTPEKVTEYMKKIQEL
jgi:hypothetical protein